MHSLVGEAMSIEDRVKNLVKPSNQDRKLFNDLKKALIVLPKLTDEQLALVNFECWHEARSRGDVKDTI